MGAWYQGGKLVGRCASRSQWGFGHARKARDEMLADLQQLGVQVNWRESVLTHSKHTRFLCMGVSSELCGFVMPPEEVVKLRAIVKDMVAKVDASVSGEWGRKSDAYASG